MKRAFPLLALALHSCSPEPSTPPEIKAVGAWARPSVPGKTATAAYLTISNRGGTDDSLVSVASSAGSAELHWTSMTGGIMRMRKLERLPIAAGETVTLEPGGTHLMLSGLREPLVPGARLELTLSFEKSRRQTIAAEVRNDSGGDM